MNISRGALPKIFGDTCGLVFCLPIGRAVRRVLARFPPPPRAPKYRHLMTYYDNCFAQDMGLLFCLANKRMRHEVNQAVSAKVHSSGRAFERFKEAINDEDLEDLLKDAQAIKLNVPAAP